MKVLKSRISFCVLNLRVEKHNVEVNHKVIVFSMNWQMCLDVNVWIIFHKTKIVCYAQRDLNWTCQLKVVLVMIVQLMVWCVQDMEHAQ